MLVKDYSKKYKNILLTYKKAMVESPRFRFKCKNYKKYINNFIRGLMRKNCIGELIRWFNDRKCYSYKGID